MSLISHFGNGSSKVFPLPGASAVASVTVNGVAATVTASDAFSVTLSAIPAQGSAVVVDFTPALPNTAVEGTFAQMKALSSPVNGATFRVTNYGKGGSLWRYSSAAGDWFPTAPVKVYEKTSLTTGLSQTAEQILQTISIEAGLLANKTFRLLASFGKNGATDTSNGLQVRFGTAGTIADTSLYTVLNLAAANRSGGADLWLRAASATSLEKMGGSPSGAFSGGVSSSLIAAATTVANMATQALVLSLTASMGGTTDKPQLGYVALEIQP